MLKHHTKDKGDLGTLKAKADLCQKGFLVLSPESEHASFDLVIYKDGVFKTVQVKYRKEDNGILTINFRSCWADKNGTHMNQVNKALIDIYCVYCPATDQCYYFDPKKFARSITLRLQPPKNSQKKKINLVSNYLVVPWTTSLSQPPNALLPQTLKLTSNALIPFNDIQAGI